MGGPMAQSQLSQLAVCPCGCARSQPCLLPKSRTLRLESFVPKNCVPHSPLDQEGRSGRCWDHEQLWRSTGGLLEDGPGGMPPHVQARCKLQPHQSGCRGQTEQSPSTRTEPQTLRSQGKLCPETVVQHEAENVGTQAAVSQSLETEPGSVR